MTNIHMNPIVQPHVCMRDAEIRILAKQIADLTADNGRLRQLESSLSENTAITSEIRDLLTAVKGGIRVLGWLGTGAKWLGAIAGAVAAIYTVAYMVTHGGRPPG